MSRRRGGSLHPRGSRGFTLLEAIVAMVIFSMGAFALYGWLSTNTITLQRIADRRQAAELRTSALEMMRLVNPMEEPSGQRDVAELRIAWTARPIAPPRASVTQIGLPNLFQVGLYQTEVRVLRDGELRDEFQLRQVGYRQAHALELD